MRGKKLITDEFIVRSVSIHGDKYSYDFVEYTGIHEKVKIVCKKHGTFKQEPSTHITKKACGCPKCDEEKQSTQKSDGVETFIQKANQVHGNKYCYDNVKYKNNYTKVIIRCNKHGQFLQSPIEHIYHKRNCPKCANQLKGGSGRIPESGNIGILYCVKLFNTNESFVKIGITTKKDINQRFGGQLGEYKFQVMKEIKLDIHQAFLYEQQLLQEFKQYQYVPNFSFNGKTECFEEHILPNIMNKH